MSFSANLIEDYKKAKGMTSDAAVANALPAITKGRLSEVKSGKRHLTEEQAMFIAHECNLEVDWVLVQLAEETAKSEEAKNVWHNLAKKLNKSVTAAILALIVVFGGLDSKQADSPAFA
ncbi:DUF3693 domain-containing protein [Rheinheimera baltica]|uniref:DUF3693 domain-containing protein n=1 Tax=Rheinheimera baltica TaxID=67576 RepID=A0ABT9HWH2_9GAMM|nr:DUF3693 domain-containing protein [Rheinheimera baltica]MDP5135485.1 DUF3693 domain-containing protein [Rheinheimera baltica]